MKVLLDMNLQSRWVAYLGGWSIPAVHWSLIGEADSPDGDILLYARTHGLIVLTQDLDFGIMLALTYEHSPSVIQLRTKDVRPETIGNMVVYALQSLGDELSRGALLTIQPQKIRFTLLPLRGQGR